MLKILNEIANGTVPFHEMKPGQMFIHVHTGSVFRKAQNSTVAYDFNLNIMTHLADDCPCIPVEADLILRERVPPNAKR